MLWCSELNTIKALMRRSTFFPKQREGAVGVSSREGSLEGSLGAVNRTDRTVSVGFNGVSAVIRKAVSDSNGYPVPSECRELFSESGWYHGQ